MFLKGVSSLTLIVCSVEWVQPNSTGSNKKTPWYLAKRGQEESANSTGQDSNPLRSSSSNSFQGLCLTVNLGVWGLWGSSSPPPTWSLLVALALQLQPLLWPTGFSFWEFGGRLYYSSSSQLFSCYLSSTQCMCFEWGHPAFRELPLVCSTWVMMLMCSPM